MNLTPRIPALGLALGLALVSTAATAGAQPAPEGDWELRVGHHTRAGHVSVRAGSRGFGVDLTHGRGSYLEHRGHGPRCKYVPGHYETRHEKVWVPGRTERVWVPAEVEVIYLPCGRRVERVVRPAHYEYVQHPGHYETRERKVWVPGRHVCKCRGGITPYPRKRHRW